MPDNKNDPAGKDACVFHSSSLPHLNPVAAKEETTPDFNADSTTLLVRQICG